MRVHSKTESPAVKILILAVLMLLGPGNGATTADSGDRSESRGGDIEPNDDDSHPSSISWGETIDGSLLNTTYPNDTIDFYQLDVKVPYGKVVTATLYHLDYDESNKSRISFNVTIWYESYGILMQYNQMGGPNRTLTAVCIQNWDFQWSKNVLFSVHNKSDSEGGRYQLKVTVSDPPELPMGEASGFLASWNGPLNAYYKMSNLAEEAGVRLRLFCPDNGAFGMSVTSIMPPVNEPWFQNGSYNYTYGCVQEVRLVALGGIYYIYIYGWDSNGTYRLVADPSGGPLDNDNFPSKATLVTNNDPCFGSVASGVDTVDWWRVEMKDHQTLVSASLNVTGIDSAGGTITFTMFDKDLKFIKEETVYSAEPLITFKPYTQNFTGPLFFAVRGGAWWGGWGPYKLQFEVPNDPPQLNGTLPNVVMDEDTPDSSFVLSEHVYDPENDLVNYTLVGTSYNTSPVVNMTTGRVTFTPKKDWYGTELVKFMARDNGPYQRSLMMRTNVTVRPVNDPPVVAKLPADATISEETEWETADMTTVFTDIDDPPANMTFRCRVVSSDSSPPGAQMPVRYNSNGRSFIVGPAHFYFGAFELELNCTDNHPGTVPAKARFNITVTHVDHPPVIAANVSNPLPVSVPERGNNSDLLLDELFTDPDIPKDYAGDSLTFSVTGMKKMTAAITPTRKLVLNAGPEQYKVGFPGSEALTVTAKDKAGLAATIELAVTIVPVDDAPVIMSAQPVGLQIKMKEGEKKQFSVVVSDIDTESRDLTFKWYIDDILVPSAKGSSFSYEPDFTAGGVEHKLRVDVSDTSNTVSNEWPVLVADVNRLPTGSITSPTNSVSFKKGVAITFAACATDPDGDPITFTWTDSRGNVIGRGPTFSYSKLPAGTQLIRLEMNDTKGSAFAEVTIKVVDQSGPKKTPGFELSILCAAVGISLLIALSRRKG